MTTANEPDLALSALRAASMELDASIPEDLLERSYAIQRNHQFDRDENRATSLQDLEKLVEEHLESESSK